MSDKDTLTTGRDLLAHYEYLIEISQQLTSTLDLGELLGKITAGAEQLTDTEASSILLYDSQANALRFEVTSNLNPDQTESIVIPIEGSIAGWIFKHGEPRVIEDVTKEPSYFGQVADTVDLKTRNLLGVPMRAHDKVIGVLEALNKRHGQVFDEQDIKTLMTLASQAAIAIENARLFQQSDFIAEMVHELRTPLVALKASTSLLLRPDLPEDRREDTIMTMRGETDRLIRMTSEFLDLARLESGRTHLNVTPFDLGKLIDECVEIVEHQAADKEVSIATAEVDVEVKGDRAKVKQVILNLLTNAIKYNREQGDITIGAVVTSVNDKPYVELSVTDTGLGISVEHQKNMFQKFFRVADSEGYAHGTGLGLAIARHIIEAHGGKIWLESERNVGSTFYITLPCA
ncbi:MAG: GAF domain-containing sensor histidine kinase [Anaerolineae bacterium]|nr:GAF domain-containing sensor histidine kinase [Anaerolineae bacterium]